MTRASRAVPSFLDGQPVPPSVTLDDILHRRGADWDRRRQQHLDFLDSDPSIYEIRAYIRNAPFNCIGTWVESFTDDDGEISPAGWSWSTVSWVHVATEDARAHLIDVFREKLNDSVCIHGCSWAAWKSPSDNDAWGGCAACYVEHELIRRGKNPNLANFSDAKKVNGNNTYSANLVLGILGHSTKTGLLRNSTYYDPEKIALISGAQQREALMGGRRVTPRSQRIDMSTGRRNNGARGPDIFDATGEDRSGGSVDIDDAKPEPYYEGYRNPKQLGMTDAQLIADRRLELASEGEALLSQQAGISIWGQKRKDKFVKAYVLEGLREYRADLKKTKPLRLKEIAAMSPSLAPDSLADKGRLDERTLPALPAFDAEPTSNTDDGETERPSLPEEKGEIEVDEENFELSNVDELQEGEEEPEVGDTLLVEDTDPTKENL
ncbi:MAG: hypothetical protein WA664_16685 [Candidatus Acidiferrales bacterium]